ncbi:MAG: DUF4199 domain-containing protein [Rikenellaceae bacterium]|nr:DUF4199 domain-containing protein [Rikenellaceae bacterium]
MNDRKLFWSRAANWGALLGVVIVGLESLIPLLSLGANSALFVMILIEVAMITVLWISGRHNVYTRWAKPYDYARSLGFVALTLMFAGIVRGTGQFATNEWLVPGYYTEIVRQQIEAMLSANDVPATIKNYLETSEGAVLRYMHNPLFCITSGVISMLDLVLLFVPPIFLRQKQDNNTLFNE